MMLRSRRPFRAAFTAFFATLLLLGGAGLAAAQAEGADPAPEVGASEAPAAEVKKAAAEPLTGYDKGFFIKSDDGEFEVKTQGRVQGRFAFEGANDGNKEEGAFSIARARLTLSGHAFTKDVEYKFQTDFGKGNVTLKDFIVDYKVGGDVRIRVGQYKRPFSRQQIASSGRQEFVDRSITDKGFNAGRDIGVMIHNNYEKSPEVEWAFGVFNANGDKASFSGDVVGSADMTTGDVIGEVEGGTFSNVPKLFGPALALRVGYNQGGIKGYSEADLEGGPMRFGVGASVVADLDADDDGSAKLRGQLDYIVKVNGISTTGGVYIATDRKDDGSSFTDQEYSKIGLHIQGSYTVNEKHSIAGRYAVIQPDGGDPDHEIMVGYSLYQHKHGLKWQTDVALLTDANASEPLDLGDIVVARSQLQLSF